MRLKYYKLVICFSILCLWMQQSFAQSFSGEGMERVAGILPVYHATDRVYLEIGDHLLGRDILIHAQINNGIGLIGRALESLGVVRFTKDSDGNIHLSKQIQSERLTNTTNDLLPAFENSNLQPVEITYRIKGVTADQGSVIDITDNLKQGDEWFVCKHSELRDLVADRSSLKEVKAKSDGIVFSYIRSYKSVPHAPLGEVTHEGTIPVEIGCVLRVLPKEKMRVRYADPRVGFRTVNYTDYSVNTHRAEPVSVIERWRLGRQKGRQITFYIAPSCPSELVPFIIRGVKEWNSALRGAGFTEILEAKLADHQTDLTSERAVISYDFGDAGVSNSLVTDISTGEILSCRINIGHGVLTRCLSDYLLQCGSSDPRIVKNTLDQRVAGEILQSAVCREVGFTLGLKPNYAGHAAFGIDQISSASWLKQHGYSASIMDENPFNYVARVNPEYLLPKISVYDKAAIEFGYREFNGSKSEEEDKVMLTKILMEKLKSPFCAYADSRSDGDNHQQLGVMSDRLAILESGLRNLRQVVSQLRVEGTITPKIMNDALVLYLDYVTQACTVPLSQQSEMVDFMNKYYFSGIPKWLHGDDQMLDEKRILKTGKELLGRMLSEERANDSLFTALHEVLFDEFNPQHSVSVCKMNLQGVFMTTFLDILKRDDVKDGWGEYASLLWREFGLLYDRTQKQGLNHKDELTKNHYKNMLRICHRELKDINTKGFFAL